MSGNSYNKSYPAMVENICEPVVSAVVCQILTGRALSEEKLQQAFRQFLMDYCSDSGELYAYFAASARGAALRLEIMQQHRDNQLK